MANRTQQGVTLVEMMVAVAILLIVMAGVSGLYLANGAARTSLDASETMEAQLRVGMDRIMFNLRSGGYGASKAWPPWVTGVTTAPLITDGGGTPPLPDTLSIPRCTSKPIGVLAADAVKDDISLNVTLTDATDIDPDSAKHKNLIYINDTDHALVTSVSGSTIGIDTDPSETGQQGLEKPYRAGTPFCRVDVVTFSVNATDKTLLIDENQGAGAEVVIDGISNLQITMTTGAKGKYEVTLTARSSRTDPLSNTFVERSLTSTTYPRN